MTPPADLPADVTALLDEHDDVVVRTALRVRAVLLGGHPDLRERARPGWHSVNYAHPDAGYVCGLFPMADRVRLALERGAELPDPARRLVGEGRTVRYLEFRTPEDVDAAALTEVVDHALALAPRR